MRLSHWMLLLRLCCLLAFGTSVALLLDYTSTEPSFCSMHSGCVRIRASGLGYLPLPGVGLVPLPVFGVAAFGLIFPLTLLHSARLRSRLLSPLIYACGVSAAALIALQIKWNSFCSLCLTVDSAALFMVLSTFVCGRASWQKVLEEEQNAALRLSRPAWGALFGLALIAPLLFPQLAKKSDVPAVITELYQPGKITIVEFFDFECPHCRSLSPRLKALADAEEDVVLRFGYTPLPSHLFARDAARISICAGEQGVESAVASKIFASNDMAREHLLSLAQSEVGDLKALEQCLASQRPDVRIAEDTDRIKAAGFEGLPTTYVGGIRILGAEREEVFQDAIEEVRAGRDRGGLDPGLYWVGIFLLFLGIFVAGREARAVSKK